MPPATDGNREPGQAQPSGLRPEERADDFISSHGAWIVEIVRPGMDWSPRKQTSSAEATILPFSDDQSKSIATRCWLPLMRILPAEPAFSAHSLSTRTIELSLVAGMRTGSAASDIVSVIRIERHKDIFNFRVSIFN